MEAIVKTCRPQSPVVVTPDALDAGAPPQADGLRLDPPAWAHLLQVELPSWRWLADAAEGAPESVEQAFSLFSSA